MLDASDHPHARGENAPAARRHGDRAGPSPRTWGERTSSAIHVDAASDHPHARGENVCSADVAVDAMRTIPTHVGRTARACRSACRLSRTIPTHVGRTPSTRPSDAVAARTIPTHVGRTDARELVAAAARRTIPTHVGRTLDFPGFNSRFQAKCRVFRMGQPVQHPPISRRPSTGHSPRCPCGRLGQLCRFCSPGNLGNC